MNKKLKTVIIASVAFYAGVTVIAMMANKSPGPAAKTQPVAAASAINTIASAASEQATAPATPSPTASAPAAPAYPAAQQQFININKKTSDAVNEIASHGIVVSGVKDQLALDDAAPKRNAALGKFGGFKGWEGTVTDVNLVSADGAGRGLKVKINISDAVSFEGAVLESDPLFSAAKNLVKGQRVKISGKIFPNPATGGIWETKAATINGLYFPNYVVDYRDIKTI